jgi:hypothetical protein
MSFSRSIAVATQFPWLSRREIAIGASKALRYRVRQDHPSRGVRMVYGTAGKKRKGKGEGGDIAVNLQGGEDGINLWQQPGPAAFDFRSKSYLIYNIFSGDP